MMTKMAKSKVFYISAGVGLVTMAIQVFNPTFLGTWVTKVPVFGYTAVVAISSYIAGINFGDVDNKNQKLMLGGRAVNQPLPPQQYYPPQPRRGPPKISPKRQPQYPQYPNQQEYQEFDKYSQSTQPTQNYQNPQYPNQYPQNYPVQAPPMPQPIPQFQQNQIYPGIPEQSPQQRKENFQAMLNQKMKDFYDKKRREENPPKPKDLNQAKSNEELIQTINQGMSQ